MPKPAQDAAPPGHQGSVHLRVMCAILASAARLVPVPFLDDILRTWIAQVMVVRTLRAHGRTFGSARVKPLYDDDLGCLTGCLLFALKLPLKLITYPIRKILAWFGVIRGLSKDLTEMLLLGRALDRCLSRGMLSEEQGRLDGVRVEAATIRRAFDHAVRGLDLRVLRGALTDALGRVKGLGGAALRSLRSLFRRRRSVDDASEAVGAALPDADRRVVEEGASQVEEVLGRPEIVALLERFDQTFDENLELLGRRAAG